MHYWLLKTEPGTYAWHDLVKDKTTSWTGVRNFQARNYLRAMKRGDLAFLYHSGDEKMMKGIVEIVKEAYPDKAAEKGDWSTVDVKAVMPVKEEVTLGEIKKNALLKKMVLVNNSRLSVQPITSDEWGECLRMSKTKLSR